LSKWSNKVCEVLKPSFQENEAPFSTAQTHSLIRASKRFPFPNTYSSVKSHFLRGCDVTGSGYKMKVFPLFKEMTKVAVSMGRETMFNSVVSMADIIVDKPDIVKNIFH
jgi:hypothetical protein